MDRSLDNTPPLLLIFIVEQYVTAVSRHWMTWMIAEVSTMLIEPTLARHRHGIGLASVADKCHLRLFKLSFRRFTANTDYRAQPNGYHNAAIVTLDDDGYWQYRHGSQSARCQVTSEGQADGRYRWPPPHTHHASVNSLD